MILVEPPVAHNDIQEVLAVEVRHARLKKDHALPIRAAMQWKDGVRKVTRALIFINVPTELPVLHIVREISGSCCLDAPKTQECRGDDKDPSCAQSHVTPWCLLLRLSVQPHFPSNSQPL